MFYFVFNAVMNGVNSLPAKRVAQAAKLTIVSTYFEGGLFGVRLSNGKSLYGYVTESAARTAAKDIFGV